MIGRLESLASRPISQRERHALLAVVVTLLACAAVLLAASRPATQHDPAAPRATTPPRRAVRPAPVARPTRETARVGPGAARVARRFLTGYLAYLYGHARAGAITSATPSLERALRARAPLVSPAMRQRYPRVLSLRPMPAPAGEVGVSALISDGELANYTVGLLLEREHGRLLIGTVEAA